ncbi:hypothetical protein HHI36_006128 [Cryptolaemus montrouzieri]|uniref:Uncharacterized protein n=1 Tax=Cryptolaemus montrouzieri TaxID=559131 RepID=A0ABD2NWD8_9CUCU
MQLARNVLLRGVPESADDAGSVLKNDELLIDEVLSEVRCNVAPISLSRVGNKQGEPEASSHYQNSNAAPTGCKTYSEDQEETTRNHPHP